ncbi:hypothetical protein LCGC14_0487870 [marine sediment metagenome]|uniref:ATP-grasp domain-containing protein n=1 Tax=marine sediment metagenome TaxID=412755 RepID=A0A0F9SCR4_9ZZZZ
MYTYLAKLFKLLSSTNSDLELIPLGNSLGLDLSAFAELRASQEDKFVDIIKEKMFKKLKSNQEKILVKTNTIYSGSIDFMVSDDPSGKKIFLLETNGGSHRGISILTKKQQKLIYNGYLEAINQSIVKNERTDNKVLVLIGIPVNDALIHEKAIMIDYFRKILELKGLLIKIVDVDNFNIKFKAQIIILIADYNQLSMSLSFSEDWVKFNTERVSVLIGDGITRRIVSEKFNKEIDEGFKNIKTIIVNPIFKITDDKSLTYLAGYFGKNKLKKYNLNYLIFMKAFNEKDLIEKLLYLTKKYKKPFVIKPNGGSGGAGVIPISEHMGLNDIERKIFKSKTEFYAKFMKNRNPFPYTIQEKADFGLIDWRGGKHTYDLRIYLTQSSGRIIPVGGLARVARQRYTDGVDKNEFVVNLSGFEGQIEVDRGIGFSSKNSKLLKLKIDDFVNLFSISSIIFANIANNYKEIINFSEWDKEIY